MKEAPDTGVPRESAAPVGAPGDAVAPAIPPPPSVAPTDAAPTVAPSGAAPAGAKRVALVISELRPGGAERVVVHLANALARLGTQVTVICLRHAGALAADLTEPGVSLVALESLRGYDFGAILRLARLLRRLRPDVINVHDRSSLPYVVLANRLAGRRPVVFSCHGLLFQSGGRARWCERRAMRRVAAVTAVSAETAEVYGPLLEWPERIAVVPNGVPAIARDASLREQVRRDLGLADGTFALLAIGNLKPEKGFEDLLEAAALVRSRMAGPPFAVLIAGGTSDAVYRRGLDAQADRLGLAGQVRFLGFRSDTRALYSAADAFVLSSRTEGLPMVLLEAMSAGLPIVATRVGGVPGAVRDGKSGLLVPPGSPERLAEAMGRLGSEAALGPRLAAGARRVAEERFSLRGMAEGYLEAYHRASSPDARPRVLMLGPLPPLKGGMATVADNLRRSVLGERCRLAVLDNTRRRRDGDTFLARLDNQSRILAKVLRSARRVRAQVVHIHTCALFTFWRDGLHALALRATGRRVIWHIHDGTFEAFLRDAPPVRRALLRRAVRLAARVIVLSRRAKDALEPLIPEAEWRVVPNGVTIPPEVRRPSGGPARLLFLGNLTRRKGAYDLVEAAARLAAAGTAVEVWLAGGEVEPGDREALEREIAARGAGDRVRVLGFLTGPTKDEALTSADALVLPSYAEGLPMAVLEGMAWGLPVIATRAGATGELLTDGQEGFLIEPGDVEALADRMRRLAEDADLRRRMGAAARRRAEKEFSLEAAVERILNIYHEVLG